MGLIFGIVFDAAIIGIVIAVLQRDSFPGWWPMVWTVLAINITANLVAWFLPYPASLLGIVAGAAVGAVLIARTCYMDFRRAAMAAGIYMGIRLLLAIALSALIRA